MRKICFILLLTALLLSACLPAPAAPTSEVSKTSEVLPTFTPTPAPTETPTPTPIPTYTIEQLKAMTPEQKLALAPDVNEAPADVLASYLPAGAEASSIAWGEQTLTFWDRVAAYHGQTADGQSVTMYYDLESGQWAKKYAGFEDAAQIPAEEVPDVMVLTDAVMGDDRLIRAKLQYDYDWISQPQVMIDGKKVFRDEKGYPKAVFDTVSKKWLTPEEADVVFTLEKWKEIFTGGLYISHFGGKEFRTEELFEGTKFIIVENSSQIIKLSSSSEIMILNPSGEITIWAYPDEAAKREKEEAIIVIPNPSIAHNSIDLAANLALNSAFNQWKTNKSSGLFIKFGKHDKGSFNDMRFYLDEIPMINYEGRTVCPVFYNKPDFFTVGKEGREIYRSEIAGVVDSLYWLDELISKGYFWFSIYANQESFDFSYPP